MVKYNDGSISVTKDSSLNELKEFVTAFTEFIEKKQVEDDIDESLDIEVSLDCYQIAVIFSYFDKENWYGDIPFYYEFEEDDDADEYVLVRDEIDKLEEDIDSGDLTGALAFIHESLEEFFAGRK